MEDRMERLNAAFSSHEEDAEKNQEGYYREVDAARRSGRIGEKEAYEHEAQVLMAIYAAAVRGELPKTEITFLVSGLQERTREKISLAKKDFAETEAELRRIWDERMKLITKYLNDFLDQLYKEI